MSAVERVRRARQQQLELEQREQQRDLASRRKLAELSGDRPAAKALSSVEFDEQRELDWLIAAQRADDTYTISPLRRSISFDAPVGDGPGLVADLIGVEDGEVVSFLPRDEPDFDKNLGIYDKPGRPPLPELSPSVRADIAARFEAAKERHLADGKTAKQATRAAICELPELRAISPAHLHEATGVPKRSIETWRRQNGGSIPRIVRGEGRLGHLPPQPGDGPFQRLLIKHQIHIVGHAERTLEDLKLMSEPPTTTPYSPRSNSDPDSVHNAASSPSPRRGQGRRDRGAAGLRPSDNP